MGIIWQLGVGISHVAQVQDIESSRHIERVLTIEIPTTDAKLIVRLVWRLTMGVGEIGEPQDLGLIGCARRSIPPDA